MRIARRAIAVWLLWGALLTPAPTRASTISTFDSDAEGWFVQDIDPADFSPAGTYPVTWFPTGGNPDGHIYAQDPSSFAFMFAAPANFLGDQSTATSISFDLANDSSAPDTGFVTLVLRTSGEFLVFESGDVPSAAFTTFAIPLAPGPGWSWFEDGHINGRAATVADFQLIMADLTALLIRGDWSGEVDSSRLDNVYLTPEPGTAALLIVGLIGIAHARRRHRSAESIRTNVPAP